MWCQIAAGILLMALQEEGIGAKTSSGYGRAEKSAKSTTADRRASREWEREKARREEEKKKAAEEHLAEVAQVMQAAHSRTAETVLVSAVFQEPRRVIVETDHDGQQECLDAPTDCQTEEFIEVEIARGVNGEVLQVRFRNRI